jgi:hypothetical protein
MGSVLSFGIIYAADSVIAHSFRPFAAWPGSRKVFGYRPSPQILKDPKSLNQRPSGASGSDSLQSFS